MLENYVHQKLIEYEHENLRKQSRSMIRVRDRYMKVDLPDEEVSNSIWTGMLQRLFGARMKQR